MLLVAYNDENMTRKHNCNTNTNTQKLIFRE